MSDIIFSSIKKNKDLKKKRKIKRDEDRLVDQNSLIQYKPVRFGYQLTIPIVTHRQFSIFGDTIIDIDELMKDDFATIITSHNIFRKTLQISRKKNKDIVEVLLDTDVYGMTNFRYITYMLTSLPDQKYYQLAQLLEKYQQQIESTVNLQEYFQESELYTKEEETNGESEYKITMSSIIQLENGKQIKEDEETITFSDFFYHKEVNGWNYDRSLQKAYRFIEQAEEESRSANWFFSYYVFKGRKYDTVKSLIGQPQILLRTFMGMNDDEIDQLLLKNPLLCPHAKSYQYFEWTTNRINSLIYLTSQQKEDQNRSQDAFRQKPTLFNTSTIEIKSIDDILVSFVLEQYQLILSNYTNKQQDVLLLLKFKPMGNFKSEDILQSQRNLKKILKEDDQQLRK